MGQVASFSSWEIEYYETAGGSIPVAEFVDELAQPAQAKFLRSLELLEQYGLLLREPWVKNIQGVAKLRELRFSSFGGIYRVFFFPISGRKLVLLHGFKKKSQETPKRELKTAEARMKDYVHRHGGKI
ncbi:MAG: type II toxin-antitoxin system RelE/ParE family toxin [Deltaproteobacteria bacterium]|nr:type II toxin-antitoxin system RelE/ParE family toxin [Deltaproteobacteria bacterium]